MKQSRLIKILKNEDGAGLVLALMVLLVFAVLGIAVGAVTIGSHKLSDISQDNNSAYYIAEAGANLAYQEIENGVWPAYENSSSNGAYFDEINGLTNPFQPGKSYGSGYFDTQSGKQPTATVAIMGPDVISEEEQQFEIVSIGEISGQKRTVTKPFTVKWIPKTTGEKIPSIPDYSALVVRNNVNINGGNINGYVYLDTDDAGSFVFGSSGNVNGTVYTSYSGDLKNLFTMPAWRNNPGNQPYDEVYYKELETQWSEFDAMLEMIELPAGWESYTSIGNFSPVEGTPGHISENVFATKIDIGGSKRLIIDNVGRDINIVVNELNVSGSGKISFAGNGKVHFYVQNKITLGGSGTINEGGNRALLRVYYFHNNPISFGGSVILNGNLLVKKATVNLAGSGNVTGALISGGPTLNLSGGINDNVLIAIPQGNIHMSGSAIVNGILVANSVSTTGNPTVNFDTFDSGILFPPPSYFDESGGSGGDGGDSGSGNQVVIGVLISTSPALEPMSKQVP